MALIFHDLIESILWVLQYAQRLTGGWVQTNKTESNNSNTYINSEFLTLQFVLVLVLTLFYYTKQNRRLKLTLH